MHLTGNNPFLRLGSDVHAGHYQFAVQYISLEQIQTLFTKIAGDVKSYTKDSPDELKPKIN